MLSFSQMNNWKIIPLIVSRFAFFRIGVRRWLEWLKWFTMDRGMRLVSTRARIPTHLFFIIPAVFYFSTACRSPGWLDATLIVSNVSRLHLSSWVNSHNLFHLIGYVWLQLFPSANIHYYLVLLSALFGACTVHIFFLIGIELTNNKIVSLISALPLMMSHSLWWHSTILEVYTLNTVILAMILLSVIRYNKTMKVKHLYLASVFFGLGCTNHILMGLFVFAFLVLFVFLFVKKTAFKQLLVIIFCFLLGSQLYLFVFIRDYRRNAEAMSPKQTTSVYQKRWTAFTHTMKRATGGDFKKLMFPREIEPEKKRFWRWNYFLLLVYNYPSAALLLGLFGFYCFWLKKRYRLTFSFFMAGLLAQVVWSGNFFVWDMYAFSLPVYVLFNIPVIMAVEFLYKHRKIGRIIILLMIPTLISPLLIYSRISVWSNQGAAVQAYFKHYPEVGWVKNSWDPIEYIANPNKRKYKGVPHYVDKIFSILPKGAHFLNDDARADYPLRLYYQDIYEIRTDIIHHSLFIPFLTQDKAKAMAKELLRYLQSGIPIYIASLEFPERLVLDQIYLELYPSVGLQQIQNLTKSEYMTSFPGVEFEKIYLFQEKQAWIYRMIMLNQSVE